MLSRFIVFGCILVFVKSQHVQYKVTISSDDEFNPDDRVSVAIYGQAKQTDHKELQGIYDKFNGHNEATFVVSAQDVGPIKQMKIKRVPNGPKEDWHVQKITIRDPKGNTYEFMCKCVLSKQKGPEVTTTPINIIKAAQEAPSPTETSPSPSTPSPSTNKPTAGVGSSSPPSEQPTGKKETTSKPTNEPTGNPGATKETSPTAGATGTPFPSEQPTGEKETTAKTTTEPPFPTKTPGNAKETSPTPGTKSSQEPTSQLKTSPTVASSSSTKTKGATSEPSTSSMPGSHGSSKKTKPTDSGISASPWHKPTSASKSNPTTPVGSTSGSSSTSISPGSTEGKPSPAVKVTTGTTTGKLPSKIPVASHPTKGPTEVSGKPSEVTGGPSKGTGKPTEETVKPTEGLQPTETSQGQSTASPTNTASNTKASSTSTPNKNSPSTLPPSRQPTATEVVGSTAASNATPTTPPSEPPSIKTPSIGELLGLTPQQQKAAQLENLSPNVTKEAAKAIGQMNQMLRKGQYKIRIKSQDDFNPDDVISIQFQGKDGIKTDFKPLPDIFKKFQGKNQVDYDITAKDVGVIDKISIKRIVNGEKKDWYVHKIIVRDLHSKIYEFLCKCTLVKDTGVLVTDSPANTIDFNKAGGKLPSTIPTVGTDQPSAPPTGQDNPGNASVRRHRFRKRPMMKGVLRNRIYG